METLDRHRLTDRLRLQVMLSEARTLWFARVISIVGVTGLLCWIASPVYLLTFGAVRFALYGLLQGVAERPRTAATARRAAVLVEAVRLLMGLHMCAVALSLALSRSLVFPGFLLLAGYATVAAHRVHADRRAHLLTLAAPLAALAGLAWVHGLATPDTLAGALFLLAVLLTAIRRTLTNNRLVQAEADALDAQAALQQTVAQSLIAEEVALTGSWRLRLPNHVQTWSPGVFRIFGLPLADAPPSLEEVIALYRAGDRERVAQAVETALRDRCGFEFEHVIVRTDGEARTLRVRGHFAEEGDGHGSLYGVVQDVTEERRAFCALQESEEKFRLVTEHASDIIARFDLDGRFTYVSPAARRVLGYAPEELVGRATRKVMHPDDHRLSLERYGRHLAEGAPEDGFYFEYRGVRKDGSEVWLSGHPRAVRDPETGEVVGFQDIVRDISSRKRMEAELTAARDGAEAAARAKSDFLANMSHELRTPLTGILGFADVLAATPGLTAEARRHAERIRRSGRDLLALVNDVLDLSKIEASGVTLEPQPVELRELVESTLDLVRPQAEAKGLKLGRDLPDAPVEVEADPDRLRQVVLNLLSNAVKFTATGGVRATLATEPSPEGGLRVRLSIADTGIGMTSQEAAQVFGRFEQADASISRRFGGTGLGLSISRAIVARMAGEISVATAPGEGSTFTVSLDLPRAPASGSVAPAVEPERRVGGRLSGLRVLLAEDVDMNRELVCLFLAPTGLEVVGVENGEAAVEAAARERFDLILMDMQMPVLDGLEAARRIRAGAGPCRTTPILALTANVLPAEIARCRAAGMDGHVGKPFDPAGLTAAVEAALLAPPLALAG